MPVEQLLLNLDLLQFLNLVTTKISETRAVQRHDSGIIIPTEKDISVDKAE
jgi:hypothetical protein